MSKYSFDRITPDDFESMAQALLEKTYRIRGELIQFGPGADGGREATWTQPITHADYCRPSNEQTDVPKEWVFQVKYHDIGQRGWSTARDAVVDELEKELAKIVDKHKVPCHVYVMITNVPFTGVRDLGTRDKISTASQKWKDHVSEIFVWDAADLSRLLDANESVRTAYFETILPGDLIKAIIRGSTFREDRTRSALQAYLKFVIEREGSARAEEAGDEPGMSLADVFIDLTVKPIHKPYWAPSRFQDETCSENADDPASILPEDYSLTPSSFALLIADYERVLLLGGPGSGKSTLTQFVSLYHSARLIDPTLALKLATRLKLPVGLSPEKLDAHCRLRIPFRIELRRYARWMSEEQRGGRIGEMARYIAEILINPNVSSSLNMDDIFAVAAVDPILLILDGLDEVPHPEARKQIMENLHVFLRRIKSEHADIKMLFSSRPKGYSGEFTVFEPFAWEINDLDRRDFDSYCNCWLDKRIRDAAEKKEALERIDRGMKSDAVRRLAQSLLQATVMLTIVRRKSEIPHQRHALYAKYVEVIFDREKEKSQVVRDHELVLGRLHERVGYELHCKMEQTNVEALDSDSFRNYVLNVLEDYSGTYLGDKKIREVADEIITAATDRLCLLVGKGKEQADIDFVVQSYREYFAAVYLFNHPDADPDRVFSALVRRGGYWANVLQFYVAQANANQQMRWVMNADCCIDSHLVNETIDLTRARRALLNVFPEFKLQRNSDFVRALRAIFHSSTRWTWLSQRSVLNTLKVLRSGNAYQTFSEFFQNFSVDDQGTLAVEMSLLAGLNPPDSKESIKLSETIEKFVEQKETSPVALAIAIEKNLSIDLSRCDMVTFQKPGVSDGNNLPTGLFSRQSHEKQCELLVAGFESTKEQSPTFFAAKIEKFLATRSKLDFFGGKVSLRFAPYLCRSAQDLRSLADIRDTLSGREDQSSAYLGTLACAAMDSANSMLDLEARKMERTFESGVGMWSADSILGPTDSFFSSIEEWVAFKQELAKTCKRNPEWLSDSKILRESDSAWLALLFHPEEWSLLVEENLLPKSHLEALHNSPIRRLFSRPLFPIIKGGWTATSGANHKVPLAKVLQIALHIAEDKGPNRLGNGSFLTAMLCYGEIDTVTRQESDDLLHKALSLPQLPSDWFSALLRLGLKCPGTDFDLLYCFWVHAAGQFHGSITAPNDVLSDRCNEILQSLLHLDHPAALQFAIAILGSGRTHHENLRLFFKKLDSSITNPNYQDLKVLIPRSVIYQTPSLEELLFLERWDDGIADVYGKAPWLFKRLLERFHKAATADEPLNSLKLRERLAAFITRRQDFPWQVPCAVLEAILKLDEHDVPPLKDVHWQQMA